MILYDQILNTNCSSSIRFLIQCRHLISSARVSFFGRIPIWLFLNCHIRIPNPMQIESNSQSWILYSHSEKNIFVFHAKLLQFSSGLPRFWSTVHSHHLDRKCRNTYSVQTWNPGLICPYRSASLDVLESARFWSASISLVTGLMDLWLRPLDLAMIDIRYLRN
jgi:hypothetical protein